MTNLPAKLGAAWDALPAPIRHLIVVFASTFSGSLVQDIVGAGGVSGLAWSTDLIAALDAGAVAAVTASGLLWFTPATRLYGIGSRRPVVHEDPKHAAA